MSADDRRIITDKVSRNPRVFDNSNYTSFKYFCCPANSAISLHLLQNCIHIV